METFNDYVADKLFTEYGFARVAHILRGFVPSVQTLGFITAENPHGKQATPEFNNESNERLEKKLRLMNLGFVKVKGQYGNVEHPFFVPNITKDELLKLGQDFEQESIIYGEKITEKKGGETYTGIRFQMTYTDHRYGEVLAERKVFINDQKREDYYTVVKGRKFFIPFFDDAYADAEFKPKSGIIQSDGVGEVASKINRAVEHILENDTTGHSRWVERGHIINLLNKIEAQNG
jgi:hypothetical protein